MIFTSMFVWLFSPTSLTKRASCRAGESFSPPTERRVFASEAVSSVGTPSAKTRTDHGSLMPVPPTELPTMSLVNMLSTCRPLALASLAK